MLAEHQLHLATKWQMAIQIDLPKKIPTNNSDSHIHYEALVHTSSLPLDYYTGQYIVLVTDYQRYHL